MALSSGTRLGHYDVTSLLGEGGMGRVWQATDTQLNRRVALKILPDAFAADPDRLASKRPSSGRAQIAHNLSVESRRRLCRLGDDPVVSSSSPMPPSPTSW